MKKISLVLCAFVFSAAAFAQQAQLGIKAGLNISHLATNDGSEFGSLAGFHAGLLAHIHVDPNLAVQPELVYSSQGTKYTVTNGEHDLVLGYLNIPVMLQYMFAGGFRLETGPQLGFLTNVNDKFRDNPTGNFSSDDFKSVDFSWSAGLGYMGPTGLGIDARYNFGISNINDAGTNELRNSVLQIGLFYQFHNQAPHRRYRR